MIKTSIKGILLRVKFFDNTEEKPFLGSKTIEKSLRSFKIFLNKCADKWEYAIVYKDGIIHSYFHKNKGTEEIDKQQYIKELQESQINLFIVYTLDYKRRVGSDKGKSIFNASIDDVKPLYTNDVEKILVYKNKAVIATYENGRFI